VYLGRMTWEEMMAPFFGVLIDSTVDRRTCSNSVASPCRVAARDASSVWMGGLIAVLGCLHMRRSRADWR
jgi:hypothetical protein